MVGEDRWKGPMGDGKGITAHGGNRRMGLADTELGLWAGRRPVGRREG